MVASLIVVAPAARAAETGQGPIAAAVRLYGEGRTLAARTTLEGVLSGPAGRESAVRLNALATLLDICLRTEANGCVAQYVQPYLDAAKAAPPADPLLHRELIRQADYYLSYGRLLLGSAEVRGAILAGEAWGHENAAAAPLYLQRQALAARILLALERPAEAAARVDKSLSLIATLINPETDRFIVAWALSDAIAVLLEIGDTERALGVYRAGHVFIARSLPPASFDAAVFRLTEARLLQQVGDLAGAGQGVEAALDILGKVELDPAVRDAYLASASTTKAVLCAARGDQACARETIARHPYAALYETAGRKPADAEEVRYLAARAFVGALDGKADATVTEALKSAGPGSELDRATGLAFAMPPGPARSDAFLATGARLAALRGPQSGVFGAWTRPGALDQVLVAVVLNVAASAKADSDASFALFQLAARASPSFDADALTVLAQARSTLERRTLHQALRLKARRDRSEREAIQAVAARALAGRPDGRPLAHDSAKRLLLRAFNDQITLATADLQAGGLAVSGANLAPLKRFQALLKPNEAALAVTPAPGGLTYMCVRRDTVFITRAAADVAKAQLDTRVLQLALTATHAPDAALDAQFPVGPATRLYDVYIRPFEPCLKAGDHLLWLSSVATLNLPLAALLERAPPAQGRGYDLANADWLVKRHSVSYPGSAAMVTATRAGGARAPTAFDFLGVGDPILKAPAASATPRSAQLAALAPLPETGDELRASAHGFRATRVLVQDKATEAGFRRELVGSYRYLSFATHGLMRDEIEGLSEPALVLTAGALGDPTNDGLLTASEIADLNLQARFVALSACNTANFDLSQVAQDLPALTSAFAVAGTPATLATLWPLNSEAGKQVVPGIFEALRDGGAPAEALAAAQRRFLADPPSAAYRHPRFWAPFVILGDGAAAPADAASGTRIASVEAVTERSGEVIGLASSPDGLAARFIGDPAGLRLAQAGKESWRSSREKVSATRFLTTLAGKLVAAGHTLTAQGRYAPTLELHDLGSGAVIASWRGDAVSTRDAILLDGAALDARRAVFVVAEPAMRAAAVGQRAKLHLMTVDERLQPIPLVDIDLPAGASIADATVRPSGDDLLLTYTDRYARNANPPPSSEDDYDQPLCFTEPVTRIELRDGRTGVLKASSELRGYVVAAADGGLLGGSHKAACGAESRAVVFALDGLLRPKAVYTDETLGPSEVRALKALPGGRTLVVGNKQNVFDYRNTGGRPYVYAMTDLQRSSSGLVLTLGRDGKASPPTMVDTGLNVFLSAAETEGPGQLVVGGSVGGGAALVRLTEARR